MNDYEMVLPLVASMYVLGLVDPKNPYWYEVAYSDGRSNEFVSVARLNAVVNIIHAVLDESDGTVEVLSRCMSASAALDLALWVDIHRSQLEEAIPTLPDDATQPVTQ